MLALVAPKTWPDLIRAEATGVTIVFVNEPGFVSCLVVQERRFDQRGLSRVGPTTFAGDDTVAPLPQCCCKSTAKSGKFGMARPSIRATVRSLLYQ